MGDDSIDSLVYLKSHYKNGRPVIKTENTQPMISQPQTPKVKMSQQNVKTPVASTSSQSETPKSTRPLKFRSTPRSSRILIESEESDETQMDTD